MDDRHLEGCDCTWMEHSPEPVSLPDTLEGVVDWILLHKVPIDPNQRIGELLVDNWYQHFDYRRVSRNELPTLHQLTDPSVIRRYMPHKIQADGLLRALLPKLRRHAWLPALREAVRVHKQRLAATDRVDEWTEALSAAWDKICGAPFSILPSSYMSYVGGVEAAAPVYQFAAIADRTYYYSSQPVVFRIGLWPDRLSEMLFSCSCGGDLHQPCGHFFLALERILNAVSNPTHPGYSGIAERIAKPYWQNTLEALSNSAVFKAASASEQVEAGGERLVWRIGRTERAWTLGAAIQVLKKNDIWSKGRKVEIHTLCASNLQPLTARDRQVLDASNAGALTWMRCLAGHPSVFDEDGAGGMPLAVTESALEPSVAAEGTWLRLGFRFGGRHHGAGEILGLSDPINNVVGLVDAEAGRFFFAPLAAKEREMIAALSSLPTRIPSSKLSDLTTILTRRPDTVSVYIDRSLRDESVEANLTPVIRMAQSGSAGLTAAVGFHLFADEYWSVPGEGPEYLLRGVRGRPTGLTRNFIKEREIAAQITEILRTVDVMPLGQSRFLAAEVEGAAALLTAMRGISIPHTVEWAEGSVPWAVTEVSSSQVQLRISGKKGALFDIGLSVQMDDGELTHRMLMEAMKSGTRYVVVAPGRIARIEERLWATAAALNAVAVGKGRNTSEVSRAAAVSLRSRLSAFENRITADVAWRTFESNLDAVSSLQPALSPSFNGELRDYQKDGYHWLCRLKELGFGACLADDMGLGKTIQALALLLREPGQKPSLVVAPTSVAPNWMRETARFTPTIVPLFHHGLGRTADFSKLDGKNLIITTYDTLVRDIDAFAATRFETVIIDEAQMVKNTGTKRSRAIFDLCAETKIALTGTPIENHLGELWSIFSIVVPGLLGSAGQFQKRFLIPIQKYDNEDRRRALAQLIRPFVLRRLKAAVAPELPPRTETVRFVELYDEERKQYEAARTAVLRYLQASPERRQAEGERFNILAQITKLRRKACHPRLTDAESLTSSAKLDAAESLIEDILREKSRALVFSQFTGHLDLVRERLDKKGIEYFYLDGAVPAVARGVLMDRWLEGRGNLFLISLKAGGTGLNLTGADYVIHLDPWWNPAVEDQATDRTHRIGQTKPVTVVRLIAAATIEEAVIALHEKKRDLAEGILQGTGMAGALSTAALVDLIRGNGETD